MSDERDEPVVDQSVDEEMTLNPNDYGYAYAFHMKDRCGNDLLVSVRRPLDKPISATVRDYEARELRIAISSVLRRTK